MAYTDATQVSNFLQRSLTPYETAELSNVIAAVKFWLDAYLNSTFDQVAATTRYYNGGVRSLDIDPCTDITAVASIDNDSNSSYTYSTTSEIVYEPQNQNVKREIRRRSSAFPRGIHRIAVTAKFSEYDGGVPADIQIVATRLVAGVINSGKQADIAGSNIKSESLEGHSITYASGSSSSDGNSSNLEGLASGDPTVAAILAARKELYVDDYTPDNRDSDDIEDGGLWI